MCSGRVEKLKNAKQVENCKVLRIRAEALVEIYGDKVVISTHSGYIVIHAKLRFIEDPYSLLDECGW